VIDEEATVMRDAHLAARLVCWGLRPLDRPAGALEYGELLDRYRRDTRFQRLVDRVAGGLELRVLAASGHGLILVAAEGSPFALKPSDFRPSADVSGRLIDGLISIAIAATVFPRAEDLVDDADFARPAITTRDVQRTLDGIVDRLREAAKGRRDPGASVAKQGLMEAWREYDALPKASEKKRRAVQRQIEQNLERLREMGCFVRSEPGDGPAYRSTYRYHRLIQDYAEGPIYDALVEIQGVQS
jgi:hypothetical protein